MKNTFLLFFVCVFSVHVYSQNVAINLSGNTGHSNAIVDLSDASNANLGFLMTNVKLLSNTDVATISNPVAGMIVWNTNTAMPFGVGFYYWSGTQWLYISNNSTPTGVTSVGLTDGSTTPIYTISNSPVTSAGTLTFTLNEQAKNFVFAGPSSGGNAQPVFRSLVAADIPSGIVTADNGLTNNTGNNVELGGTLTGTTAIAQNNYGFTISGGAININNSGASATVIGSGGTGPVTIGNSTGNTFFPQMSTQYGLFYSSSTGGELAQTTAGTIGQVLTQTATGPTWENTAPTGVTSVGFADASTNPIYTITNSPVTSTGTITTTLNTQPANQVFAGPASGAAAQPAFRALVAADLPSGIVTADNGLTINTGNNIELGGTLTKATTITQATNTLTIAGGTINLNNTGSSSTVIGNNTGMTGINQASPKTTLDVNGALSTELSSTITALTSATTTTITVGNSSYIQLTSNQIFSAARPFTLSPGLQTGQRLVVQLNNPTTTGAELVSGTNVSLLNSPILFGGGSGNSTLQALELIWNGSAWVDIGMNKTSDATNSTHVTYDGGDTVWTCPAGVTSVLVKVWGAGGAGSNSNNNENGGGGGAFVEGMISVTPGTQYTIVVGGGGTTAGTIAFGGGGAGTSGDAAGGGGGYSGIFATSVTQANALVIAGGGGGGANANSGSDGNGCGGGGGAPNGANGGGTACATETGGGGGTTTAGGAAGLGGCGTYPGNSGVALTLPTATTGGAKGAAKDNNYGGGGGGGFYGGGSGGCYYGAGGGGGSSWTGNAAFTLISNQAGSNGTYAGNAAPGGNTDPDYISGVGVGSYGTTSTGNAGGNGMVIIYY